MEFVSIQDKITTGTAAGKAMFGILSVLVEFERNTIRERTMTVLKTAHARGRKGGRPNCRPSLRSLMLTRIYPIMYFVTKISKRSI